jgi:hypothetical protein
MLRQDYIKRLIEQMAEAMARIVRARTAGTPAEAEAEIQSAERSLGLPVGSERLEARSLALLAGDGDKVVLLMLLMEQRAHLAAARGDQGDAARLEARVRELLPLAKPKEMTRELEELRARLGG